MLHIHKRAKLIALKGDGGGEGEKDERRTPAAEASIAAMNTERIRRHASRALSMLRVSNATSRQTSSCKTTMQPDDENENDELDAKRIVAGLLSSTRTESEMGHVQDGAADSETTSGTTALKGIKMESSCQMATTHSNPLQASFETLDGVVCMYRSRCQPCALSLVRKAVEDSCGRGFDRKALANLVAIYPNAYHLTTSSTARRDGDYDIIIEMGLGGRDTLRKTGLVNSGGSLLLRRKEEFRCVV